MAHQCTPQRKVQYMHIQLKMVATEFVFKELCRKVTLWNVAVFVHVAVHVVCFMSPMRMYEKCANQHISMFVVGVQ